MRTCRKCKEIKPLTEFYFYNELKGWRRHECKECNKKRQQGYARESKSDIKARERAKTWQEKNPDNHRKNALAYYYRMQDAAIQAYGGYKCACCGETEPLFITLDHINNGGNKHRKEIGSMGGHTFYKWLKDNQYPEGYQVLCMNCNHGKHRNGGICPHKESVTTIPSGSTLKRVEAHDSRKR